MKNKPITNAYVQLPRHIFSHPFWMQERIFSRAEAWIDMVQMAVYKEQQVAVGAVVVSLQRGELVASVRYLSQRWKWSNGKVLRFLSFLEDEGIISRRNEYGQSLVSISVYGNDAKADAKTEHHTEHALQPSKPTPQQLSHLPTPANGTPDGYSNGTAAEHQRNKYNKEKKEKKVKEADDAHGFLQLQQWMQEHTPAVLELTDALTPAQYTQLLLRMDAGRLRSLLLAMQHYPPLLARYRSAYHTVLRFDAYENKLKPHTTTAPSHEDTTALSPASQQLKAAISRKRYERG